MPINTVYCVLSEDKTLFVEKGAAVCQGENLATAIKISVPAELNDYLYALEFDCPKGKKYISGALEFVDDEALGRVLEYLIPSSLTYEAGDVRFQVTARDKENFAVVFKSEKSGAASFFVTESVGYAPTAYQKEDFFAKAAETFELIREYTDILERVKGEAERAASEAAAVKSQLLADRQNGVFDGPPNVLSIGTVAKGAEAAADIGGESPNQILNLMLPKGDKGDGAAWITGELLSREGDEACDGEISAAAGDFYLNTLKGNLYRCRSAGETGSEWEYLGCIKGPPGVTALDGGTPTSFDEGDVLASGEGTLTAKKIDAQAAEGSANLISSGAVKNELDKKSDKPLVFRDVSIPAHNGAVGFVQQSPPAYAKFPFRATVTLEGVTADMIPEVVFGADEGSSGEYAPVAETFDGGVYLYATVFNAGAFVVPLIVIHRGL